MLLKPFEEQKQNEEELTITEEREDSMISPSFDGNPTFRIAHFLKPLLKPNTIQPLPKTPFLSPTSNPNSIKGVAKKVLFRGIKKPLSIKLWVDDLQQTHESIWKKVGIFDAIKCTTYNIRRDKELIMCLAEKWCPETNTFVFSWGECTITLEDIMVLGGFSVMGDSVVKASNSKNFAELKDELVNSCPVISRNSSYNLSVNGWLNYYKGKGGDIEHVALLVLWLSRYVFPLKKTTRINKSVFGIAINLAMGIRIALAPAILASIYRDMTLLKYEIESYDMDGVVDSSKLVVRAPFHLVQLWGWERFRGLSPRPNCLSEGEPRIARWHNVKKLKTESLRWDIESDAEGFVWRPYVVCVENWNPKCYSDGGMQVVINSELDEELLSYVRCLRPSELVGLDCVMQYLPHRVGMQFGMDQDIPNYVPRSNANYRHAWSSYDKPLKGVKVYIPPRLFEGDVTIQYARWWSQVLVIGDDALRTCTRRKRSARKRKSSYQLDRGMGSRKQQFVLNEIASGTRLDEQEDTSMYDAYPIPAKDHTAMVNRRAKGSMKQKAETVDPDVVGIGSGNGVLSGEGPSIDAKMNALSGENVKDVKLKIKDYFDTIQMKTSEDNVIEISDEEEEEENPVCNRIEVQFADFEARMNKLDKILSGLKAAKGKAMVL